jgi:hypothetical protein
VDETLVELGVFLVGAGGGAALSYLKDRRLLHLYSDLVRQLSKALQEQLAAGPRVEAAESARLLRAKVEEIKERNTS